MTVFNCLPITLLVRFPDLLALLRYCAVTCNDCCCRDENYLIVISFLLYYGDGRRAGDGIALVTVAVATGRRAWWGWLTCWRAGGSRCCRRAIDILPRVRTRIRTPRRRFIARW